MKILVMKIKDINNYNSEKFIDSFKNIYEESKFITEHADKKRPFKNKKEMILVFLELFDNLDEETKINIIKKHPDLADKIKINKGLSELSDEEQTRSGLKDCSEEEFNFKKNISFGYVNSGNSIEDLINKNLSIEVEKKKYPVTIIKKPLNQKNIKDI